MRPWRAGFSNWTETDTQTGLALRWLVAWVSEHREINCHELDLELPLFGFGLDSVEMLELSLDIERTFGIQALFDEGWRELGLRAAARRIAEALSVAN